MWNYTETNAFDSISLHDCRTDNIKVEGKDLIINFPDGFWITPVSKYIDHDRPLKTGPAQLRFIGFGIDSVIDTIDLYKNIRLFRKTILCKRVRPEVADFLKRINDGKHELEFLYEFHNPYSTLYKCCLWRKPLKYLCDCQIELTAKSIEYYWNEICRDREW